MMAPVLSPAMDKPEWLSSMEAVLEVLNEGVVITNETIGFCLRTRVLLK
jgi:hypothetical protein